MRIRHLVTLLIAALTVLSAVALPAGAASTAPVYARDFPDPFVLRVGQTYYAYSTQVYLTNTPVLSSTDLVSWTSHGDALPGLPSWAAWGHTWAPGVVSLGGAYRMYYTVRHRASGRQCISIATSTSPLGPFRDASSGPLVCQLDRGGSIDPYPLVDSNGVPYLIWKSDDNALGNPTVLWAQRLNGDGRSFAKKTRPQALLRADAAWEHGIVEGPAMVKTAAGYHLFYGAAWWESPDAGIGYAVCSGPLGPCSKKTTSAAWLGSGPSVAGPAGPGFFTDATGATQLAYHGWPPGRVGYSSSDPGAVRSYWLDRVTFDGGVPSRP